MVLLLTDVFLLLTQVLLWIIVGLVTWFVLLKALPRAFLSLLVLLLILIILVLSFFQGPPAPNTGVLDILWRIISFPFSPFGLGLILLLILLSGTKLTKLASNIIKIMLVILLLGCFPIVAYFLAQELEWEGIRMIQAPPAQVTGDTRVIVLLGQGTTRPFLGPRTTCDPQRPASGATTPAQPAAPAPPDRAEEPLTAEMFRVLTQPPTQLPIQLTEKADRLTYAAQLYRQGPGSLIVISAPQRPDRKIKEAETNEVVSEAKDIQTFLNQTLGIPCEAMRFIDHNGTSVHESAKNIKKLLADNRVNYGNRLTIVSTAMNTERTFRTFREVFGFCPLARPTDFYTLPSRSRLDRLAPERNLVEHDIIVTDFLPSAEALYISTQAIEEYLTSGYYFLRGWIRFRELSGCREIATRVPTVSQVQQRPPTLSLTSHLLSLTKAGATAARGIG